MRTTTAISSIPPSDGVPGKAVGSVFHSLTHLERTSAQIQLLLAIAEGARAFLGENKSVTDGFEIDKESKEAARTTAIHAFAQLDNIVDDQIRWGREDTDTEKDARELLQAETERVRANAKLMQRMSQPFIFLQAQLHRTHTGKILASTPSGGVHAFGDTADEAVKNFNRAFEEATHLPVIPPSEAPLPRKSSKPKNEKSKRRTN